MESMKPLLAWRNSKDRAHTHTHIHVGGEEREDITKTPITILYLEILKIQGCLVLNFWCLMYVYAWSATLCILYLPIHF